MKEDKTPALESNKTRLGSQQTCCFLLSETLGRLFLSLRLFISRTEKMKAGTPSCEDTRLGHVPHSFFLSLLSTYQVLRHCSSKTSINIYNWN